MPGSSSNIARHPWIIALARFGYLTKGVVYLLVGGLAARAAIGPRGTLTSKIGALQLIVKQPLGMLLLGVITVGLGGYVLWRLLQAILDTERKGADARGLITRAGYAANGLFYGALVYAAIEILTGSPIGANGEMAEDWTARVLNWPFGPWLIGAGGLIVAGAGLYEGYCGYTAAFETELKLDELGDRLAAGVRVVGRVGLIARALVYVMIGMFLIRAARQLDAEEAGGMRQALDALASGPLGPWALGALALGLIAYGIYLLFDARYRRLRIAANHDDTGGWPGALRLHSTPTSAGRAQRRKPAATSAMPTDSDDL